MILNKTKPFQCMLAHPVGKKQTDWSDAYIQPKLDGVRCYITSTGAFSRNHKPFHNINHILRELEHVFSKYPDIILDGELYNHKLKDNFNKIISLVRKQKPTFADMSEAQSLVQFHCYDMFNPKLPNDKYYQRASDIDSIIDVYDLKYTKPVTFQAVLSLDAAKHNHQLNLNDGYEGSILRYNKPYEQKRSYNLQKFKDFHDTEATIVGWVEGQGKRIGTIGKFLAVDSNGVKFGMPVMGKQSMLEEMYDIAEWYIGKTATFTYFQRTPSGSYRHPLFKCIRNYE